MPRFYAPTRLSENFPGVFHPARCTHVHRPRRLLESPKLPGARTELPPPLSPPGQCVHPSGASYASPITGLGAHAAGQHKPGPPVSHKPKTTTPALERYAKTVGQVPEAVSRRHRADICTSLRRTTDTAGGSWHRPPMTPATARLGRQRRTSRYSFIPSAINEICSCSLCLMFFASSRSIVTRTSSMYMMA